MEILFNFLQKRSHIFSTENLLLNLDNVCDKLRAQDKIRYRMPRLWWLFYNWNCVYHHGIWTRITFVLMSWKSDDEEICRFGYFLFWIILASLHRASCFVGSWQVCLINGIKSPPLGLSSFLSMSLFWLSYYISCGIFTDSDSIRQRATSDASSKAFFSNIRKKIFSSPFYSCYSLY